MWKRKIAYVQLFLALFLPFTEVAAQRSSEAERLGERSAAIPGDLAEQGEIIAEQFGERFEEGGVGQPGIIGEDILFNIREYQPQMIRSSLLEDQNIYVKALLQATATNPSISIPQIKNVVIRRQKITTSPLGAPVSIGRVRYVRPPDNLLRYENMGHLIIPLRAIPRENDVPDEIIIDLEAQVFFEISQGLLFGPMKDVLMEQNHDQWLQTREDHSFYAGYLRVSEIKEDQAVIHTYDTNGNEVRGSPLTLKVGQTSRSMNARAEFGYSRTGNVFDRFTIKLDSISSLTDKARMLITRDGTPEYRVISEGESLYPGSSWYVENIIADPLGQEFSVKLRNKNAAGTLDENTKELKAKKLQISPEEQKKTTTSAGSTSSSSDTSLLDYKKILAKYTEITQNVQPEEAKQGYKNYNAIVEELEKMHSAASLTTKKYVEDLLKTIQQYYNTKRLERSLAENANPPSQIAPSIEDDYSKVTAIVEKIAKEKATPPAGITTGSVDLSRIAYQQARDEYQKLIDEFSSSNEPEIRKQVAQAHWRIAKLLPADLVRKETRLYHLETLQNQFEPEEYRPVKVADIKRLIEVLKTLEYDYQSVSQELTESTTGEVFSVVLVGAEKAPEHLKSIATITLDGARTNKYEEGQQLQWQASEEQNGIKWIVREIKDNTILVTKPDGTDPKTLVKNTEIMLEIKAGVSGKIKLIDTVVQKEAHVTVSPVVEQAFSEAIFSLHLPIEKRALDLPLFSDTVEQEIAKTEDLLKKLDEILINVKKITEYWQKFCLITFGVLMVKNFFSGIFAGSNEFIARDKTTAMFKERWEECQGIERGKEGSCADKTYDQYIFEHQSEYENTIGQSEQILNSQPAEYHKDDLGPEYNNLKKDHYYYKEMSNNNPKDEALKLQYFKIDAQLKQAELNEQFSEKYFVNGKLKSFSDLGNNAEITVKTVMESDPNTLGEWETSLSKEQREQVNVFQKGTSEYYRNVWDKYGQQFIPRYRETSIKDDLKTHIDSLTEEEKFANPLKEAYRIEQQDTQALGTFNHKPAVTFATEGKGKDSVEFISLDAMHYVRVSYRTGGRVDKYELLRRTSPNDPMGHQGDVYLGEVDEQMLDTYRKADPERQTLSRNLNSMRDCISRINKQHSQSQYSKGDKIATQAIGCGNLGKYAVEQSAAAAANSISCTEFMNPTDCKLLFNACDPVICPPSRCNLDGNWYVDNVVETGLIGSAALCFMNWIPFNPEGGVVMPVCLTGIHAGLQNIRSILEGYKQCLITAKVSGTAVGLCDSLRSFGICEILWKEGIAIFNAKEGILSQLDKLFGGSSATKGGGEYSAFSRSLDNTIKSTQYFTQSYAKNTFARYAGGSLPEIGSEICKAAIFRKAPGLGNFFDEITRPESPPQFNAFFDEAPYSDTDQVPLSQYKVFYHIYAGETIGPTPLVYSVWLQAKDPYANSYIYPPTFIQDRRGSIRGRRLAAGAFVSDSPDVVLPSGMQEICIETITQTYGRRVACGFGKVSTGFALNYLADQFTQSEVAKRVNSAAECVSKSSTIAEAVAERGAFAGAVAGSAGTVSSGLVATGVVRKCSKESPGIGGDEDKWSPVGSCGTDERGIDMGTCWLYVPAAKNLIKEVAGRTEFSNTLNATARKVIEEAQKAGEPIPGFTLLSAAQVQQKLDDAEKQRSEANKAKDSIKPTSTDEEIKNVQAEAIGKLLSAREFYIQIITAFDISEKDHAKAQFELAQSYEEEARILLLKKIQPASTSSSVTPSPATSNRDPVIETIEPNLLLWEEKYVSGNALKVKGKGFDRNAQVRVNNDNIKTEFRWISEELIEVDFDPSSNSPGNHRLTVVNPDGKSSDELLIILKEKKVSTPICRIANAYWGDQSGKNLLENKVFEGEKVTINVLFENCKEDEFNVGIYEDDNNIESILGAIDEDDPIGLKIKGTMVGNRMQIEWFAVWTDDSAIIDAIGSLFKATESDSEYIFRVYEKGKNTPLPQEKEDILVVRKGTDPEKICNIIDAYWAKGDGEKQQELEIAENEDLYMVVESKSCLGKTANIQFAYENFGSYTPFYESKNAKLENNDFFIPVSVDEKRMLSQWEGKNLIFNMREISSSSVRSSNILKIKKEPIVTRKVVPSITSIAPDSILELSTVVVEVTGNHFDEDVEVIFPSLATPDLRRKISQVTRNSDTELQARIETTNILPGRYNLFVYNPKENTFSNPWAIDIIEKQTIK